MYDLEEAVDFLSTRGMNVSVYNSQLCLMPETLWKYTKKSISDWKNIYLDECSRCTMINNVADYLHQVREDTVTKGI